MRQRDRILCFDMRERERVLVLVPMLWATSISVVVLMMDAAWLRYVVRQSRLCNAGEWGIADECTMEVEGFGCF